MAAVVECTHRFRLLAILLQQFDVAVLLLANTGDASVLFFHCSMRGVGCCDEAHVRRTLQSSALTHVKHQYVDGG